MSFPAGPQDFIDYFERVNRGHPGEHWANGVDVAKRWLSLAAQPHVSQSDVDELLARLRGEPDPGSGWTDLTWQFEHWAEQRGFRV